jgi:hypothetical protein
VFGCVDSNLAQETAKWYALVNTVLNVLVAQRQEISSQLAEFVILQMLLRGACELIKYTDTFQTTT